MFGPVASDPTVSRMVDVLAADADRVLAAIDTARASVRAKVWSAVGDQAPDHEADALRPLIVDVDATLVTAYSDKEGAATFKRGYGFHPMWAFVDHGPDGAGEPLAVLLRRGNAGSNTAADLMGLLRQALRQLPSHRRGHRPGRRVLVRSDAAGCTHEFFEKVASQRMSYSVGFTLPADFAEQLATIPAHVRVDAGLRQRRQHP